MPFLNAAKIEEAKRKRQKNRYIEEIPQDVAPAIEDRQFSILFEGEPNNPKSPNPAHNVQGTTYELYVGSLYKGERLYS